ncbi:MAG TPA: hypothetical protein V6D03_02730 [Candidatus Caenarcaniphilales bacterium]
MPRIQDWCDEALIVHWHQEDSNLRSWVDVHGRRMRDDLPGRLRQPMPAHLEREIPQPAFSVGTRTTT